MLIADSGAYRCGAAARCATNTARPSRAAPPLIIEGDNFDGLRPLRSTGQGAGDLYRPAYTPATKTGCTTTNSWARTTAGSTANGWDFLYQRLLLARDLLTSDGVILVSINDENRARLELLMDEVFPGRRVG